jgi:predicted GTPase
MRLFVSVLLGLMLTACNSVYYKPHTLDKDALVYASRGGYSMQRSIKQTMEERGYNIHVGTLKTERKNEDLTTQTFEIPNNAKYAVSVEERKEFLRPIWCMFNGFWWWNFNVSITEKSSGKEILSWRGRGCQNSSIRKLNAVLDELEK